MRQGHDQKLEESRPNNRRKRIPPYDPITQNMNSNHAQKTRIEALLLSATLGLTVGAVRADAPDTAPPAEAASLSEAITGGKLLLELRPRYERVEQSTKAVDADAFTLRTLSLIHI